MAEMSEEDKIWQKEKFRVLLEACAHAINRARYVFIAVNIAGIFTLAGLFNATLPWLRNAIERARIMSPPAPHLEHIQRTMYQELWTLTLPVLGLKFSVFDISVIASTALLVLALWQYYCVRRENEIVHTITEEALRIYKQSNECASYLYHGIAHYFVFTQKLDVRVPAGHTPRAIPTVIVQTLLFMPAWVLVLIVVSDLFTIVAPHKLALHPADTLWTHLREGERVEAILRMVYATALALFSYFFCKQSLNFDLATRGDLERLQKTLQA
jgi:hypothetical protein